MTSDISSISLERANEDITIFEGSYSLSNQELGNEIFKEIGFSYADFSISEIDSQNIEIHSRLKIFWYKLLPAIKYLFLISVCSSVIIHLILVSTILFISQLNFEKFLICVFWIPFTLIGNGFGYILVERISQRYLKESLFGILVFALIFAAISIQASLLTLKTGLVIIISIIGLIVFYSLLKIILKELEELLSPDKSRALISLYVWLFPVFLGIVFINSVLFEENESSNYQEIFLIGFIPYLIGIIIPWVIIHKKYYEGDEFDRKYIIPFLKVFKLKKYENGEKIFNYIISGAVLFMMLLVEVLFGTFLYYKLEEREYDENFWIYLVFLLLIPFFTIGGLIWSGSKWKAEEKIYYGALAVGLISLPVTFLVYVFLPHYTTLLLIFLLLPLVTAVFWGTLAIIWEKSSFTFRVSSSTGCLFLLAPVGILSPFYFSEMLSFNTSIFIALSISSLFFIVLSAYGILKMTRFCQIPSSEKKLYWKKITCNKEAIWISMVLFLTGLLIHTYILTQGTESNWAFGLLGGILFLLPFLFTITILIIRSRVVVEDDLHPDEILDKAKQKSWNTEVIKRKRRIQEISLFMCLASVIVLVILAGGSQVFPEEAFFGLLTAGIGLFLISIFLWALVELKARLKAWGENGITVGMSVCECLVFFPFFIILPSALALYTSEEELTNIVSFTLGFTGFVIIFGVSTLSILFNLFLKKMEAEKKKRFCIETLQNELEMVGVKGDVRYLRNIYDRFLVENSNEFKDEMLEGKHFFWFPVPEGEKDLRFSKYLIMTHLMEAYKKKYKTSDEEGGSKIEDKMEVEHEISFGCWDFLSCFEASTEEIIEEKPETISIKIMDLEERNEEELIKKPEHNFMEKIRAEYGEIENIQCKVIPKNEYNQLTVCDTSEFLLNNPDARREFYSAVFHYFARGDTEVGFAWLQPNDLVEFMRLIGLLRFSYMPESGVETFYTQQLIYKNEFYEQLTEEIFLNKVIPNLARMRYSKETREEREAIFFKYWIYPYLSYNIPEIFGKGIFLESEESVEESPGMIRRGVKKGSLKSNISYSEIEFPPEIPEIPENERSFVLIMKIEKYLDRFFDKIVIYFQKLGKKITDLLFACVYLEIEKIDSESSDDEEENQKITEIILQRRESPDWPSIVHLCLLILEESVRLGHLTQINFKPKFSISNILLIIGKIAEFFTLAAIAFRPEIDWGPMKDGSEPASDAALLELDLIRYTFWLAVGLSVIYLAMSLPAMKKAKKGTLGKKTDGTVAGFLELEFYTVKLINLLGGPLYMMIMKSLLALFACDTSSDPWIVRNSDMECLSVEHIIYALIGFFSICVYYPVATFLFPTLEFNSEGNDYKFDTTFLVILSEAKLIISAAATLFPYEEFIEEELILSAVVLGILAVASYLMEPCIVESFNLWNTVGYFIGFWSILVAIVNLETGMVEVCFYGFWVGLVFIVGAGFGARYFEKWRKKRLLKYEDSIISINEEKI